MLMCAVLSIYSSELVLSLGESAAIPWLFCDYGRYCLFKLLKYLQGTMQLSTIFT